MSLISSDSLSKLVTIPSRAAIPAELGRPVTGYTPSFALPARLAEEMLEESRRGRWVLLCGRPGAAKTTALGLLAGLVKSSRQVILAEKGERPLAALRREAPERPVALLWEGAVAGPPLQELVDFAASSPHAIWVAGATEEPLDRMGPEVEQELAGAFRLLPAALPGRLGEWEELVARSLLVRRPNRVMAELGAHADMRYQLSSLVSLQVYPEKSREWIGSYVVQGGYPLHPAANFLLPRLSALAGTGSRNAFTFFLDQSSGGLGYFLHNFAVAQPGGRLSLYTPDLLYTYFQRQLAETFPQAHHRLEEALAAAADVPMARALLRTTWLLELVDHDRLNTTPAAVLWALHLGKRETETAGDGLRTLVQRRLLAYDREGDRFSLALALPHRDASEVVRTARGHLPERVDAFSLLQKHFPPAAVPARGVNEKLHTDRFVETALVRPEQLGRAGEQALHDRLSALESQTYRGDLLLLYVVAQRREESERVHEMWRQGRFDHPRLVLALPFEPTDFAVEANRVAALDRALGAYPPFNDPTTRRHHELKAERDRARRALDEALKAHLAPENLILLAGDEAVEGPDIGAFQRFLDLRVSRLLGEPPVVPHRALATLCDPPSARRLRRRALDYLAGCRGLLALRAPEDEVLRKGLVDTGLASLSKQGSRWSFFEPSFATAPGRLGELMSWLEERTRPGSTLRATDLVAPLTRHPWSLPASTLEFVLAALLWGRRGEIELRGPEGRAPANWSSLSALVGRPGEWELASRQIESPPTLQAEPVPGEPSREEFQEQLRDLFGGAPWPVMAYRWFSSLPDEVREQAAEDDLHLLLSAYSSTSLDEDEGLDDMMFELGYGSLEECSRELLDRLRLARAELDGRARPGFFPVPDDDREEFARECLRYALERARLPAKAVAEILQHQMERVAFS